MERFPIDPAEVELRRNLDSIASLNMIGEGAPIFERYEEDESAMKKPQEQDGVDEENLPRDYQ